MALEIIIPDADGVGEPLLADRALYCDEQITRLVDEQDAALVVVSHPGKAIPVEFVQRLALVMGKDGRVVQRGVESSPKDRVEGETKQRKAKPKTK